MGWRDYDPFQMPTPRFLMDLYRYPPEELPPMDEAEAIALGRGAHSLLSACGRDVEPKPGGKPIGAWRYENPPTLEQARALDGRMKHDRRGLRDKPLGTFDEEYFPLSGEGNER